MSKLTKRVTATFVAIALIIGGFTAGTLAAKSEWLFFTGDSETAESTSHTDEIMEILREVNGDKISAEEALAELEEMNPPGLVRQIKELKAEIERLESELEEAYADNAEATGYIEHLESELHRANTKVTELNGITTEAVEEAREIGGR